MRSRWTRSRYPDGKLLKRLLPAGEQCRGTGRYRGQCDVTSLTVIAWNGTDIDYQEEPSVMAVRVGRQICRGLTVTTAAAGAMAAPPPPPPPAPQESPPPPPNHTPRPPASGGPPPS